MDDISFNLCALPLVFLLGTTETSLAAFFVPSFQVFISTGKTLSEPSCVQNRESLLSQPFSVQPPAALGTKGCSGWVPAMCWGEQLAGA